MVHTTFKIRLDFFLEDFVDSALCPVRQKDLMVLSSLRINEPINNLDSTLELRHYPAIRQYYLFSARNSRPALLLPASNFELSS